MECSRSLCGLRSDTLADGRYETDSVAHGSYSMSSSSPACNAATIPIPPTTCATALSIWNDFQASVSTVVYSSWLSTTPRKSWMPGEALTAMLVSVVRHIISSIIIIFDIYFPPVVDFVTLHIVRISELIEKVVEHR